MDFGAASFDSLSRAGSFGLFLDLSLLLVLLLLLFKLVEDSFGDLELTNLGLTFLADLSFVNVSLCCLILLGPTKFEDLICELGVLEDSLRLKLESDLSLLADENPLEELVRFDTAVLLLFCFSLLILSLLKSFNLSSMECFVGVPFWLDGVCGCC